MATIQFITHVSMKIGPVDSTVMMGMFSICDVLWEKDKLNKYICLFYWWAVILIAHVLFGLQICMTWTVNT